MLFCFNISCRCEVIMAEPTNEPVFRVMVHELVWLQNSKENFSFTFMSMPLLQLLLLVYYSTAACTLYKTYAQIHGVAEIVLHYQYLSLALVTLSLSIGMHFMRKLNRSFSFFLLFLPQKYKERILQEIYYIVTCLCMLVALPFR